MYRKLIQFRAKELEVYPRHLMGRSTFAIDTLPYPLMWTYWADIHGPCHDRTNEFLELTEKTMAHIKSLPQEPLTIKRAPQFHKYGVKLRFARKENSLLAQDIAMEGRRHKKLHNDKR